MFYCFTSEDNRQYVLDNLRCSSSVHMAIEIGLSIHTVFSTPRIFIQLCFIILPVKIEDTMC